MKEYRHGCVLELECQTMFAIALLDQKVQWQFEAESSEQEKCGQGETNERFFLLSRFVELAYEQDGAKVELKQVDEKERHEHLKPAELQVVARVRVDFDTEQNAEHNEAHEVHEQLELGHQQPFTYGFRVH